MLKPVIVQNLDLLRQIRAWTGDAPPTAADLGRVLERDKDNTRKSLLKLEEEGAVARLEGAAWGLTAAGDRVLKDLARDLGGAGGEAGVGQIPGLAWARIKRNPLNPRTSFDPDYIAELAESIAEGGLKTPLVILKTPGPDGSHLLEDGECRHRAIGLLIDRGDPRWPADRPVPHFLSEATDDTEVIINALITGIQKQTLAWGDRAAAFADLIDNRSMTTLQVAVAIGSEAKQRHVQQLVKVWRELGDNDRRRARLPEGAQDRLNFEQARLQVQRAEESVLKLDPKALLTLAEIVDHVARHKANGVRFKSYVYGDVAEVADGAGGEEYETLRAQGLVHIYARKAVDGRSYVQVGGYNPNQVEYRLKCTLPVWSAKTRGQLLDQLRREALGDAEADAAAREKRYSVPWLNGPFEIPESLAKAQAKAAERQVAKDAKARAKAEAETARRQQTMTLAAEIGRIKPAGPFDARLNAEFGETWGELPWSLGSWGGVILDAKGKQVICLGWDKPDRAKAHLLIVAVNAAGGFDSPSLQPKPEGGATQEPDDEDEGELSDEEAAEISAEMRADREAFAAELAGS